MARRVGGNTSSQSVLVALALGWIVHGCAPAAQTDAFATLSMIYDPVLVWHASHENGLRTVVVGGPFDGTASADHEKLRTMLRLPPWHQRAEFTIAPDTTVSRGYRLVLVFNPAAPLSFGDACENLDGVETLAPSSTVHLHAAFCSRDRPISEIDGHGSKLQAVLDQTLAGLLPPENRDRFDEGRCVGVFRLCL